MKFLRRLRTRGLVALYPWNGAAEAYQNRQLRKGPRIAVLGGGTGLSVMLRGLKQYTANITAIVAVTDDGGSSGKLRGQFGILPPGDLRNCLVALADTEPAMKRLFSYRFKSGSGLEGHNLGNLLITALADMSGSFETAIEEVSKVLAIRGRVLPSTLDNIVLGAKMEDGSKVLGESNITRSAKTIKRVFTLPEQSRPLPEALEAILEADLVVIGPGSLYTSIIPNLLVPGIVEAIEQSRGVKVYVANIMTQPGETDGYSASDHLKALYTHSVPGLVDHVVLNDEAIPAEYKERYAREGSVPVRIDKEKLKGFYVNVATAPLLCSDGYLRHDSLKLARLLVERILGF